MALRAALGAMQAGLPEQVHQLLGGLLQRQPVPAEVQFVAGSAAYELQHYGEAVERLTAAVNAAPERFLAHSSALGFAHHKLGEFAQASECFERIVAVAPEAYKAHYGLALVALADGRLGEARTALERCLALQPDYEKARFAEARLLEAEGRDAAALAAVEQVVLAWPSHDEALYLMARLLARAGRQAESEAVLERRNKVYALRESLAALAARLGTPDDGPGVRLALAEMHLRLEERAEARKVLEGALRLYPGQPQLVAALERLVGSPPATALTPPPAAETLDEALGDGGDGGDGGEGGEGGDGGDGDDGDDGDDGNTAGDTDG